MFQSQSRNLRLTAFLIFDNHVIGSNPVNAKMYRPMQINFKEDYNISITIDGVFRIHNRFNIFIVQITYI